MNSPATDSSTAVNPFQREQCPRGLRRWIPGLQLLRTYQNAWLIKDLSAGLVLTAILVPVGMGYAEAAGLPAIYGLYATSVPLAAGNPDRLVALAGMLALLSGALCLLARRSINI